MTSAWRIAVPLLVLCGVFLAGMFYGQRGAVTSSSSATSAVLYYRDPMHPSYTSDRPGKAPDCGMALEPVYAESALAHDNAERTVYVSPERQQISGVVMGRVENGRIQRKIRTSGHVTADESRVFPVTAGADGIVRKVFRAATNTEVRAGDPLLSVYGREYVTAQRTYLYSLRATESAAKGANLEYQDQPALAVEEARLNLLDMGFGETQLQQIRQDRKPALDVLLGSPAGGVILARNAYAEQRFNRGAELFRIADLRVVWILADLFGEEAGAVKAGATARISVPDRPGYALMATVAPSQPQYDAVSRVTKLRLESPNPELILRPDMFVTVEFSIPMSNVTSVPAEAVVDSGSRKTVFVESGNGLFEARPVQTGVRFDNRVQITSGLQPGEPIVVSGNFLLDSESWMRSATPNRPARPPDTAQLAGHGAPRHD